ncbi:MAG: glycosyltransferase family 39 protein [Chloroflexota bacterium]
MRGRWLHNGVLLAMMLVGYWLRVRYFDRSMRFDEALSFIEYVSTNMPSIMANYSEPNNHIFHSLLAHVAWLVFGNHPVILRMAAWIPGVVMIPFAYEVGRKFYGRGAGLLAAAIVAVSPSLLDMSVNARGYSLQVLITLMLFWLGQRLLEKNRNNEWLWFALLSALGFLTIPTMLYPMGAVALWLLLSIWFDNAGYRRRVLLKNYVVGIGLGAVLTLILYVPVMMFSGLDRLINNPFVQPVPPGEYYPRFYENYAGFFAWAHQWLPFTTVTAAVMGFAAVAGLVTHRSRSPYSVAPLVTALVWVTLALLVQRVFPYPRIVSSLMPIYFMTVGAGIVFLTERFCSRQGRDVACYVPTGIAIVFVIGVAAHTVRTGVIITSPETGIAEDAEIAAFYFAENITGSDSLAYSYPSNYTVRYYEGFHGIDTENRPESDRAQVLIYYHSDAERERLLNDLIALDPAFDDATFEVVEQFAHSTLEEIIRSP